MHIHLRRCHLHKITLRESSDLFFRIAGAMKYFISRNASVGDVGRMSGFQCGTQEQH